MKTTFPVAAPPDAWAALADPERLAAALPGCRSVIRDADGDRTLRVVADVGVASVAGLWAGTVVPVDGDAVRVTGSGAPGSVDLVVRADPERTSITVEGTVEGALETVGSAVLAAAVRRTAEDLLTALAAPRPSVPSRGHGFLSGEPEVMGSRSGTHDLGLGTVEPVTSAPSPPGRRFARRIVAVTGVIAVAILAAWRRASRRRAG